MLDVNTVTDSPGIAAAATPESPNLRRWQKITIILLTIGYAGYYLCRSDLSVATPLLIAQYGWQGVNKEAIGAFVSLGTLGYAVGKFVNGTIADYAGGRRMFLTGMIGAIAATVVFALGGIPYFTVAWVANRLIQSTGWVGMVKITGRWFRFSQYGSVMGLISLSFLFGDFASRVFLGQLVNAGYDWKSLFLISAAVLGVILIGNFLLLKASPKDVGEDEPEANPENVYGTDGHEDRQTGVLALLKPLLGSGAFWAVCALSFGFTLIRETFNNWTPEYLTEVARMTPGDAGTASSLFPLFGGLSVIACGYLSDRIGRGGRAAIIFFGLLLSVPALLALGYLPVGHSPLAAEIMLGAIAFVMLGPYSFLAGAVSLDFGGKKGSATAAGWIDGIGYLGGMLAGSGIGEIATKWGWGSAFLALAVVTAVSCIAALLYWRQQKRATVSA